MGEDSILALVGRRHHGRDHLPLCAGHVRLTKHPRAHVGHQGLHDVGLEAAHSLDVGDAPRVLIIMS